MRGSRQRRHLSRPWVWPSRAATLLLLAFWTSPLRAQLESALELRWTAPVACSSEAEVRKRISALAPTPAPRAQPLRVEANVRAEPAGPFMLELEVRDGDLVGRRQFEGDSCKEVEGAAAVVIALLLNSPDADEGPLTGPSDDANVDADGIGGGPAAGTTSGAHSSPGTTGDDGERDAATRDDAAARDDVSVAGPLRAVLEVPSLRVGFGFLSRPSFGLSAGGGFEVDDWRVVLAGTWNLGTRVLRPGSSNIGADVGRQQFGVSLCRWLGQGRIQVAPCALLAVQRVTARGVGPQVTSAEATYAWSSFGPELLARLRLSERIGIRTGGSLEIQAAHPALVIEGVGEVEQIGSFEVSTIVGAEWIF